MKEIKIEAPFMQWFTADGYFVAKPFQQWLAASIPLIGQTDPKNAEKDIGVESSQEETVTPSMLDGIATGTKKEGGGKKRRG